MEGENITITSEIRQKLFSQWVDEGSVGLFEDFLKANTIESTAGTTGNIEPVVESKPILVDTKKQESEDKFTFIENHYKPTKNRDTKSVNFNLEEKRYIDEAIQARVTHNLSRNAGHFIRQCMDIAMNADYHVLDGKEYRFAISENPIEKKALIDAFFSNYETNLKPIK